MYLNLKNVTDPKKLEILKKNFANNGLKLTLDANDIYVINLHDTVELYDLIRALNESGYRKIDVFEDRCYDRIVTVL